MLTANLGDSVGLIIFLLFLTILLSALTELISAIRQRRNRYLEDFITETLRGSGLRVSDFYEKTLLGPDVIKGIRPAYIHSSEFVAALLAILRAKFPTEASTVVSELSDFTIDELKNFAASLPEAAPLRQILIAVILKASDDPMLTSLGNDASKVRATLANWYDNSMDLVSAFYKRSTLFLLLGTGIVLAAIFNLDMLNLIDFTAQSAAIKTILSAPAPANSQLTSNQFQDVQQEIEKLKMPLGWTDSDMASANGLNWWLKKVLGLLTTAYVLSQVALLYFDAVNRVTNLRMAGKPPDKSPIPTW